MAESHLDGSAPVGLAVVGASAGGVEALKRFVAGLPADLGCPVVVVLHVSSHGTSVMPQILERAGALFAVAASDGQTLSPGHLYVAPPDRHVLLTAAGLRLSRGPRVNGHRPAIDPTMESAARTYGPGAVGIVLSGTRDDGTAGLAAIKAEGGRTLVQDPDEALYADMPRNAMAHAPVDAVMPVAEIARWLAQAAGSAPERPSEGGGDRLEPSAGRAYFTEGEHGRELDKALSTATRALDDRAGLLERLAARARVNHQPRSAAGFERQARDARADATVIRRMQHRTGPATGPPTPSTGPAGA